MCMIYVRACQTIMRCIKQIDYDDDYVEMACIITSYSDNKKSNPLKVNFPTDILLRSIVIISIPFIRGVQSFDVSSFTYLLYIFCERFLNASKPYGYLTTVKHLKLKTKHFYAIY